MRTRPILPIFLLSAAALLSACGGGLRLAGDHWVEVGWESYFNALSFGYQGKYAKVIYRTRQPLSDQGNVNELGITGFVRF